LMLHTQKVLSIRNLEIGISQEYQTCNFCFTAIIKRFEFS
jgi:hypothetical protein